MIIYQMKNPISCGESCVGVIGDNAAHTHEFYIKGAVDESVSYTLHLRFSDGSVNSVIPDEVSADGEGTLISWVVKKNDIFKHGFFEVQIEARNSEGLVFQTEIVRLYADESLPVEDQAYENPNSETLRMRDEAYSALEKIRTQQKQIELNIALVGQTDLNNKADKAATLEGYGITDAYTKTETDRRFESRSNKVDGINQITDTTENYPSVEYLNGYYYDYSETNELLDEKLDNAAGSVESENISDGAVSAQKLSAEVAAEIVKITNKADRANSLAGYGITDAYTKDSLDKKLKGKLDAMPFDSVPLQNSPCYITSGAVYNALQEKYDVSNIETGGGSLTVYTQTAIDSDLIASADFKYQKTGKFVQIFLSIVFNEGSANYIQFTGLPFSADTMSNQNRAVIATDKHNQAAVYPVGSWLALNFMGKNVSFTQGEVLKGVISIIIK